MRAAFIAVITAGASLLGPAARAAPGDPSLPAWTPMPMFGNKATLCRMAGLSDHLDDGRLTLELIRLLHGEQLAGDAPVDRTRAAVLEYLDVLDAFNRAVARSRLPQLSSAGAAHARTRDAGPLLAFLGLDFDPKASVPWHDATARADGDGLTRDGGSQSDATADLARAPARRQLLVEAGLRLDDLVARLNRGENVPLVLPRLSLPLPLPAAVWCDIVFGGKVHEDGLFRAIVRDPKAAHVYHGLLALDSGTLEYFGSHPGLLAAAARRYPGVFAACARAIHIRGGHVQVPGGEAADSLWKAVVGRGPDDTEAFVRALLAHGSTAYFYDALAHLDAPHLEFALGTDVARFRALHAAFTAIVPEGSLEGHPFMRPADDGALLLAQLRIEPAGRLAAPAWNGLWSGHFDATALPNDDQVPAGDGALTPADAATIADLVLRPIANLSRHPRLEAVLFAQRVFARATPAQMPAVFVAVRGFPRFETLALTLEHMEIEDPATYARAMRCAARLSDLRSVRHVATALSQFQGAVALLDRLASRNVFGHALAVSLLESLLAVPVSETGYRGSLVDWFGDRLLPALDTRLAGSADTIEDAVLLGLAGTPPPTTVPGLPIEWEEQLYRIDIPGAELDRLLRVRRRQGGNRLDDAVALRGIARELAASVVSPADGRRLAARLTALTKTLQPVANRDAAAEPAGFVRELLEAARAVERSPDSQSRRAELSEAATQLADDILGDVLRSLAYAAAIGDPESNLLLGSDMAAEHDFGVDTSSPTRLWSPWAFPTQQSGSGVPWHLAGSLLAIDRPLARFSLRRISNELPLQPTRLDLEDASGLAHAAVLMRPSAMSDAARDRLVALIALGRRRAATARTPADQAALLAAIAVSEWRRNVLAWQAARGDRSLAQVLTLSELLWLGARSENATPPDEWGPAATPLTGCLCQRFGGPETIEVYGVRASTGLMSALLPDITLRLAELTAETKLPAALVPALLLGVTEDVIETARPAHADDWLEVAEAARDLPRERFEDQVAALTVAGGPLVPVNRQAP